MALPRGAGSLNERVTILRLEKISDSMGGYSEIECEVGTFFAQVNVLTARDNVIADQERDYRTHEIFLRAGTAEVLQGDIISWRGYKLDVRATRPVRQWIVLDCVTRTV